MKITYIHIPSVHSKFHTIEIMKHKPCTRIELSLPKDFSAPIFPLGSANGEGKSTLLQYVYSLLTYWSSDNSLLLEFIEEYIDIQESNEPQVITTIHLWDEVSRELHILDFQVVYKNEDISLVPINIPFISLYLITHSCESHEYLIKSNTFFYYEDIFNRVSNKLSLGEKKYNSLVDWVNNVPPKGSVVMMDNPDVFLHPDWQYQLVWDIEDSPLVSQYILATHSYNLCEALTPAHVLLIRD